MDRPAWSLLLTLLTHSSSRYDPQTNMWSEVQSMHTCRGGVGLTSLGGYMFAVGGHDGKSYLSTTEMYSPTTNTWNMVAPMKTCRAGAGVVSCPLSLTNVRCLSDATESLDSL